MKQAAADRPLPAAPGRYVFPRVARTILSNGLRVAVAPMPRLPLVTVLALVDAGASRDMRGGEGLASLAATGLAEGTTRRDGAALAEAFELLGTGLHSASSWDESSVGFSVTPPRLRAAMALLGEVLRTPSFAATDVGRLKAERLAELLQQRMEPGVLADEKFDEFLYAEGSRYAAPMGGSRTSVRILDAELVRAFHARHYAAESTTLIVVGDIGEDDAFRLAEHTLGDWQGRTQPRPTVAQDDRRDDAVRVHIVDKADAPQTELRVGHRGVPRGHADYFPIVVMNTLLGGLFSSRINLNLRERNAYTYGAHSAFVWRRGTGPFVVSTAVKTEVTEAAAREILIEIDRMRGERVDDAELTLATAYLDGVFPIRYETTQAVADAIATATTHALGDDYFTRYRDRVRAVTAAGVQRAARAYLRPEEVIVVAVGDARTIREPLGHIGLGPVQVHPTGAD